MVAAAAVESTVEAAVATLPAVDLPVATPAEALSAAAHSLAPEASPTKECSRTVSSCLHTQSTVKTIYFLCMFYYLLLFIITTVI